MERTFTRHLPENGSMYINPDPRHNKRVFQDIARNNPKKYTKEDFFLRKNPDMDMFETPAEMSSDFSSAHL